MDGIVVVRAALIIAGVAFGTGVRARGAGQLDRPVILLGIAGVLGSIAAAVAAGAWPLPVIVALGVLGYVLMGERRS